MRVFINVCYFDKEIMSNPFLAVYNARRNNQPHEKRAREERKGKEKTVEMRERKMPPIGLQAPVMPMEVIKPQKFQKGDDYRRKQNFARSEPAPEQKSFDYVVAVDPSFDSNQVPENEPNPNPILSNPAARAIQDDGELPMTKQRNVYPDEVAAATDLTRSIGKELPNSTEDMKFNSLSSNSGGAPLGASTGGITTTTTTVTGVSPPQPPARPHESGRRTFMSRPDIKNWKTVMALREEFPEISKQPGAGPNWGRGRTDDPLERNALLAAWYDKYEDVDAGGRGVSVNKWLYNKHDIDDLRSRYGREMGGFLVDEKGVSHWFDAPYGSAKEKEILEALAYKEYRYDPGYRTALWEDLMNSNPSTASETKAILDSGASQPLTPGVAAANINPTSATGQTGPQSTTADATITQQAQRQTQNDTLRPLFGIANPIGNIPSTTDQLLSGILFNDFHMVAPGFGLGVTNKMYLMNEIREKKIRYHEPLSFPRTYGGPTDTVLPPPLEFQNEMSKRDVESIARSKSLSQRLRENAINLAGEGSLNILGDDYGLLRASSAKGLPRPADSIFEPVVLKPAPMERVRLLSGIQLKDKHFRRLFDPERFPEHFTVHTAQEGGSHYSRQKGLRLLPFAIGTA
jgi:hypothetical protein